MIEQHHLTTTMICSIILARGFFFFKKDRANKNIHLHTMQLAREVSAGFLRKTEKVDVRFVLELRRVRDAGSVTRPLLLKWKRGDKSSGSTKPYVQCASLDVGWLHYWACLI